MIFNELAQIFIDILALTLRLIDNQKYKLIQEYWISKLIEFDIRMIQSEARLHFDIYDFEGEAKVDYFNLGDILRSLDLRPTQAMIEKNGGTKKKGMNDVLIIVLVAII